MSITRRSLIAGVPVAALAGGLVATATATSAVAEAYPRRVPVGRTGRTLGWNSGVTTTDPVAFGTWRGTPVAVLGMFADASVAAQREVYQFANGKLNCDVDLAVGGPIEHTWAETAAGKQVPLWKEVAAVIRKNWRYRTVYLRFAHEANGTWMKWSVAPKEVPAFKKAFRLFATTMRSELRGRDVKIVFAPNFGTWFYSPDSMWPGSDVVDVVGVSMYEWTIYDTATKWRKFLGSSIGPAYWSNFARRHGRPMALSEWGGRSPYFLRAMNAWMRANAGTGPGRLAYDVYLNDNEFTLTGKTASAYRSLVWGR